MVAQKLLKSQHILYVEKVDTSSTKPASPQMPEDNIRENFKNVHILYRQNSSSTLFFQK